MAARTIQSREIATGISDLISALDVELGMTDQEARRAGYYSPRDAATAMGLALCTAQRRLKAAHIAGTVERVKINFSVGGAGYYYRPLKQGGKIKANSKGLK